MWSRLLKLFGNEPEVQKESPAEPISPETDLEITTSKDRGLSGPSSLIGYNYMGRKNDKDLAPKRNFINLTKLLRGDYGYEESEEDAGDSR